MSAPSRATCIPWHPAQVNADTLRRIAADLERQAATLRRAADELDGADSLIRTDSRRIINATMRNDDIDTTGRPKNMKIGAARSRRTHPAMTAWYAAGKTITAIATEVGETRARVSAWLAPEPTTNRPIPSKHAAYFERTYGIPTAAWLRIGD
jgi:hypothetical protein